MESRKIFVLIRYIAIFMLILTLGIDQSSENIIFQVIIILAFIINNQLRFFTLSKSKTFVKVSIIIEGLISAISYKYFGGESIFYFLISVMDSGLLLKNPWNYIINTYIISVMSLTVLSKDGSKGITSIVIIIILSILSVYIKQENEKKLGAQKLYDKLRISEEKLKKANEDLERYASSIEELTLLRERNRISREIHDSVGHSLSTIMIQLGAIEKLAINEESSLAPVASNLREFVKSTLDEVRGAVRQLKPLEYSKYEGILAIEELIKNFKKLTSIDVRMSFSEEKWALNSDQSFAIYRVVQEFLSNSARHGKATKINIFMKFSSNDLIITLSDNGRGCSEIIKGIGLNSIEERVKEVKGNVTYNSDLGQGFWIKVIVNKDEI